MDERGSDPGGMRSWSPDLVLGLATFVVALLVALVVIQPFRVFAIGSDSASSVLYFDRIAAGHRLEAFLGTTPKPLLTLAYGALQALTSDWRAIGLLAAVVYALGVAATTVLVRRIGGSLFGALFVAAGLVASWQLFQDVSLAYAGSWLLASCGMAGLALTRPVPRWGVAGGALLAGSLARQEGLFVTGLGLLGVTIGALIARRNDAHRERIGWAPLLLALGLLAVPLTAVHDVLLTGDPLYSLHVQSIGVAGRAVPGLAGTVALIGRHFSPSILLVIAALVGLTLVAIRRQWVALVGLLALGPAVLGLVLYVGWRNLIVLERYLLPVDLALVIAAGLAVSAAARAASRVGSSVGGFAGIQPVVDRSRIAVPLGAGGAMALALLLSSRVGPLDERLRDRIALEAGGVQDFEVVRPVLARELAMVPGMSGPRADPDPETRPLDRVILLVPARYLPAIATELDLGLDRVAPIDAGRLATDGSYPLPGWLVYHQAGLSTPEAALSFLESQVGGVVGALSLEPLATVDGRAWLVRVGSAP